ncbi:amino acid adenylation domain-containing protein [Roseobacter sp.]
MEDRIAALKVRVAGLSPDQQAVFRTQIEAAGIAWDRVAPAAVAVPDRLPLSPAQMQFWLMQAVHPDSAAFSIAFCWDVAGALDIGALRGALQAVMDRHAPLCSAFPDQDGVPWQAIDDTMVLPFSVLPADDDTDAAERAFAARPFDLATGPVWRVALHPGGPQRCRIYFAFHHIIADGWSRGVFLADLTHCYQKLRDGQAPDLPPLNTTFADHVLGQDAWCKGDAAADQTAFWHRELADLAPQDLGGHTTQMHRRADTTVHEMSHAATADIKRLAQALGVTPFMVLLAAFQVLLHRQTGGVDIAVGTPTAGRLRAGSDAVIGLFMNTLVLRNQLSPHMRFCDWVDVVRAGLARAFEHQDLPFARVVETVGADRAAGQNPLFQCLFQLQSGYGAQNGDTVDLGDPDVRITQHVVPVPEAKFDLSWHMVARDDRFVIVAEYRTAVFEAARIADMIAQFETLLAHAVARPEALIETLDFVPAAVTPTLIDQGPACVVPDLWSLIAAQQANPQPAITDLASHETLDYWALLQAANTLARQLRARPELQDKAARMAICLRRGPGLVVAMVAALQAGIAYVPLDPDHPETRRAMILDKADVALVLCDTPFDATCPMLDPTTLDHTAPQADLGVPDPHGLAYLIFTSGSTGAPKGVPITRYALSNLVASVLKTPGLRGGDRLLAVTTVAFDISVLEIFAPLACGAGVVLADRTVSTDPAALIAALDTQNVTHMQATPATWRLLVNHGWQGAPTLTALCGGEALSHDLAAALLPRVGALWNMYGPTETTIWSGALRLTPDHLAPDHLTHADIPFGGALANTTLHVVDQYGKVLPADLPGELAIGGAGLSPGYWRNTTLTAARFPTLGGARMYLTGDRAARNRDGTFRFLGRLDDQIKLNGHRIEPAEIETLLTQLPGISQALVTPFDNRLVAYVSGVHQEAQILRATLAVDLPGYMIPASFVWLDVFPLNPNGKIDRARLPKPDAPKHVYSAPETQTETQLQAIWAGVLAQDNISIDANFFDLGGTSVSAMQIASRARSEGLDLQPTMLFEHQTIRAQAAVCQPAAPTDAPMSVWQANGAVGAWSLRLPLPECGADAVPAALERLTQLHPALGLDRDGQRWVPRAQSTHWAVRQVGDHVEMTVDAALLDTASVALVVRDLAVLLAGATPQATEPSEYMQWLQTPTPVDACTLHPLRHDGGGGVRAPVHQQVQTTDLRTAAGAGPDAPKRLLAAAILRVLAQWQQGASDVVLIEEPAMASAGQFTRAVPLTLPKPGDHDAAMGAVHAALSSAPGQGVDPCDLPEGLAVLSWRDVPVIDGTWHQTPPLPTLRGAALTVRVTQTAGRVAMCWDHDPSVLRGETVSRLAAKVLSEITRPPVARSGSKLDKLRSQLLTKGDVA